MAFLEIGTEIGAVTVVTHVEHNGYYGGFGLTIEETPSAYLARDEQYKQAVEDVRVTLEALKDIYQCMGGDDSAAKGWNAPEDVWEIALDAITAIRARYPEPDDAR